jgi:hypothetical protein
VRLSALAVDLEKPFRVLICKDWYLDSKNSIDGRIHLQKNEERASPFDTSGEFWEFS